MPYVDGYVLTIPTDKIDEYRAMADNAGKIWKKHGALQYIECVGDDLSIKDFPGRSFLDMAGAKQGETVVFAYVVYDSRAHRDEVNAKVMADPALEGCGENMPFDVKNMAYGGFKPIVSY